MKHCPLKHRSFHGFALIATLLTAGFLIGVSADAADILVDTSTVHVTGARSKIGLNLNAGVDDDVNQPASARPLADAVSDYGANILRYPGGKKSLYYAWTKLPSKDPRTGFWVRNSWYASAAEDTLNFDEFMTVCQQSGSKAHINVAYNPSAGLGSQLAASWVEYANITKGHGIKYWEIGNEMWQTELGFTKESLAAVVIEYSNAMKAVDPTIKIGVSWKSFEAAALISLCGSALDFFTISNYTEYGGSLDAYRTTANIDLNNVNGGLALKTIVSEYGATTWRWDTEDKLNCTGKGLIIFDMTGQFLKDTKCEYACLWNTRWYAREGAIWEALNNNNGLMPNAQPLSIYRRFLKDSMVKATSGTSNVVSYASYDPTTKGLSVFLINKATTSETVNVNLASRNTYEGTASLYRYRGNSYTDINPTMGDVGTATVSSGNAISNLVLPAVSITAIEIKVNEPVVLVGGTLRNGNFNANPGATVTYALTDFWYNTKGAQTEVATRSDVAYDGTQNGNLTSGRGFGQDTGHTIVEGHSYGLGYVWKDYTNWIDSTDQVTVSLFTTSDNSINGTRTNLVVDASGLRKVNGAYETVSHHGVYTATSATAGKRLFVAIETTSTGYSRIDNFELWASNPSQYLEWTSGSFVRPFINTQPNEDSDEDAFSNLQEFAFGMDPTDPISLPLSFAMGGNLTQAGAPVLTNFAAAGQPPEYRAVFSRRKDHVAVGLTYSVGFSADLARWTTSAATPTVLTADSSSTIEAVSVPFLSSVPTNSGGNQAPRFFRVGVSQQ